MSPGTDNDSGKEAAQMKKTIMLFAEGFEEVEALTVVDLLRRAQIGCDMISVNGADTVTGSHIAKAQGLSFLFHCI